MKDQKKRDHIANQLINEIRSQKAEKAKGQLPKTADLLQKVNTHPPRRAAKKKLFKINPTENKQKKNHNRSNRTLEVQRP